MLYLLLATVLVADPVKPADKPAEKPAHGQGPRFSIARIVGDDIIIKDTMMAPVKKEVTEEVIVDGKKETRTRTVVDFVPRVMELKRPLKDFKVFGTDGKKLDAKVVADRLKADAVVVVSMGEEVDPIYLKALKEGTVVVVFPRPNFRPLPGPGPDKPRLPADPAPKP